MNLWSRDSWSKHTVHLILLDIVSTVIVQHRHAGAGIALLKKSVSVFLELLQAVSLQLELQDLSVRTGLRDQSRLLLGPFSCSASLEARWCRHSGSPGPEPGHPKLLLDLKGGLLQVRSSVSRAVAFAAGCRGRGHISTSVLLKGISTKTEGLTKAIMWLTLWCNGWRREGAQLNALSLHPQFSFVSYFSASLQLNWRFELRHFFWLSGGIFWGYF